MSTPDGYVVIVGRYRYPYWGDDAWEQAMAADTQTEG